MSQIVTLRLEEDSVKFLDEIAESQRRTRSGLICAILAEWIENFVVTPKPARPNDATEVPKKSEAVPLSDRFAAARAAVSEVGGVLTTASQVARLHCDLEGNVIWAKVKLPVAVRGESQEDEYDQMTAWAEKHPPALCGGEQEPLSNWCRRMNGGGRVNLVAIDKARPLYVAAGGMRDGE